MASPAETSQQPSPAPTTTDHHFDPIEFWYLHKTRIIAFAGLLAVGLTGYTIFTLNQRASKSAAEAAYAGAKSIEDFRKVASSYAATVAGANAQLRVAGLLRDEGKLDEANAVLREFTQKNSQHPMIAGAWLSLAANSEAANKLDDALAGYQKVTTNYPGSFAAPVALMGQARIHKGKGQNDQAKRIYEQVLAQYQSTPFQMEAMRAMADLKPSTPEPTSAAPVVESKTAPVEVKLAVPESKPAAMGVSAPTTPTKPIEATSPPVSPDIKVVTPEPKAETPAQPSAPAAPAPAQPTSPKP